MKKIYSLVTASALALSIAGCSGGSSSNMALEKAFNTDENEVCNVKKLGIEKVIANAKTYNDEAIKEKVEYRRLEVNNSDLIIAVEEAIKSGKKEVNPKTFKGKPSKTKLETNFAAERACKFGLNALQNKFEAKSTWRYGVPGDKYNY